MEKANPVEMRMALKVVDGLKNGGILFVPMPVLGERDRAQLLEELERRLDMITKDSE